MAYRFQIPYFGIEITKIRNIVTNLNGEQTKYGLLTGLDTGMPDLQKFTNICLLVVCLSVKSC